MTGFGHDHWVDEEFVTWAAEQLRQYESAPEFKSRVAAVLERQKAGEDLSTAQIAEALEIPLWLAEFSMMQCIERVQARVIVPDSKAVN